MSTIQESAMEEGKLHCKENIDSHSQQKQTSHMIKVMLHLPG